MFKSRYKRQNPGTLALQSESGHGRRQGFKKDAPAINRRTRSEDRRAFPLRPDAVLDLVHQAAATLAVERTASPITR